MKCERILSAKIDISKKAKQQRKYNKELYDTHCLYLAEAIWGRQRGDATNMYCMIHFVQKFKKNPTKLRMDTWDISKG